MNRLMERNGEILYIRLPREMDHHAAEQLRREADQCIRQENIQKLVFDFAKTDFCDSSGIGMLMGRYRMIRALGGEAELIHVNSGIRRVLTLSGVTKLMTIRDE